MKKALLIATLLILSSSLFAQTWLWGAEGSSQSDTYAVAADAKGNGFLAGGFSPSIKFGAFTLTSVNQDSYLTKYDTAGNVLWAAQTKTLTALDKALTIYITTDKFSNIYATGYFAGKVAFGKDTLTAVDSVWNVFLAKYNTNGKELWARQSVAQPAVQDYGQSVATDNSGNVFVTGFFKNNISFGTDTLKSTSRNDNMFIVKYDSGGNVLWARQSVALTHYAYGQGYSVTTDKAGNAFVTGAFMDTVTFGALTLKSISSTVFLAKYDANGNMLWAKAAGLSSSTDAGVGNAVVTDNADAAYITGQFTYGITFGTYNLTASAYGIFLAKYSSAGNVVWAEHIAPSRGQDGYSLAADSLEHIYLSGGITTASSSSDPDPAVIIQFDSAGKALCYSTTVTGGDDNNGVAVSPSGKYVYLGGDIYDSIVFGKDTLHYHGGEPPFIARWKPCIPNTDGINEVGPYESITVYPNPSNGVFQLKITNYELGMKSTVEVYNVLGEKVYSQPSIINSPFSINLKGSPTGVYFIRVYDEGHKFSATTKIIIE